MKPKLLGWGRRKEDSKSYPKLQKKKSVNGVHSSLKSEGVTQHKYLQKNDSQKAILYEPNHDSKVDKWKFWQVDMKTMKKIDGTERTVIASKYGDAVDDYIADWNAKNPKMTIGYPTVQGKLQEETMTRRTETGVLMKASNIDRPPQFFKRNDSESQLERDVKNQAPMHLVEFEIYEKFPKTRENILEVNGILDELEKRYNDNWFRIGGVTRKDNKLRVSADRGTVMELNRKLPKGAEKVGMRWID